MMSQNCTYPDCNCPFDSPGYHWCARGYKTLKEQKMETKENKLPLPFNLSRCLGHNGRLGDACELRDKCARHATISHIDEPWELVSPPYYRMCSDEKNLCFMEFVK